jgi:hypothetical protein
MQGSAQTRIYKLLQQATLCTIALPQSKNGNGSGSDRVDCLGTRNRNPNLKPESAPNIDLGKNPYLNSKPADHRNPTDNSKPDFFFLQTSKAKTTQENKSKEVACK